jgi:hypothetical protein
MNSSKRTFILVWIAAYSVLLLLGYKYGLEPLIFPTLLILAFPPCVMHCIACYKVTRRTKLNHPEEWKVLGGGLQLKYYLFDDRNFGDDVIARAKADLRWWLYAGGVSIVLYLPTLFTIAYLEKS